jgi:hypothetical protein
VNIKPIQRIHTVSKTIMREFPSVPENKLMGAIVVQAVLDLNSRDVMVVRDAQQYLSGSIDHAFVGGVDPSWVKRVCREGGVL